MTRKREQTYVARSTGVVLIDGVRFRYVRGRTRVRGDHPVLRQRPDRFVLENDAPVEAPREEA